MATLMHAKSRRLYSWWWDSHISPKNSKWLQENLTDMDVKVKTMIKLIEEDADSFARRAEMYYKKRPELMKLVEEFYRAYRALAEKYDHATGALCQAHRTMEKAFPNEIPFVLPDGSLNGSSESLPHSPVLPPLTAHDPNNLQKDDLGLPSQFHDITRNEQYSQENSTLMSKNGLKQLNVIVGNEGEASQLWNEDENLKSQIASKSELANIADVHVQSLNETISKLKSDKEAALLEHQVSLGKISNMEKEISRFQHEYNKLNDEMSMVVAKLNSADDHCVLMDKTNQALQLNLDTLNQRAKKQQEELAKKQEELERLNISIQEEHLQILSLERLQSQVQEEVRLLALEVQSGIKKLKDNELNNMGLEEEIRELKEENGGLNEQIVSSALKIISLQDEIIFLKGSQAEFEDDLGLHVEEKKVLHQEFSYLKADGNDLKQRHHLLTEQIRAVNLNVESLQKMVKELHNGNAEVRERCKKHEDEKVVHLENLKHTDKLSKKIKALEESSKSLNSMISLHISEKAVLMSQLKSVARDMEIFSERNTSLEKSLSDANVELEGLRGKLKDLEESYESLCARNSNLLSEKAAMMSEVQRATQSREILEMRYAEVEVKRLNVEREKFLALDQVMELQDSIKLKNNEYEALSISNKSQLNTLRIHLLHEKSQVSEEEFEVEQYKIMDARTEIFILQRCLCDINEKNSFLAEEYQKLLLALKCKEKFISEFNQELLVQEKRFMALSEHINKLNQGILLIFSELQISKDSGILDGVKDEVLLQLMLHKLRGLLNSFSDAQDERQQILLEKSVIVTILEQFGLNLKDVMSEKNVLVRESSIIKTEELPFLQGKEVGLLEMNEQLRHEVHCSNQRREVLITQLNSFARNVESISDKNTLLEKSLSDSNVEVEGLRRKSNILEESCPSLSTQDFNFHSEKSSMVSQVERTSPRLEKLETRYAELEGNYINLEREKDSTLCQVIELQDSLQRKKEEYETLFQSSKIQLSILENQIHLLQDENRIWKEKFEGEQHKILGSQIERFILKRCLCNLKENSILAENSANNLVPDKLISDSEHQLLSQEKKFTGISEHSEKLREGIQLISRELCLEKDSESLDGTIVEVPLHNILHETNDLMNSVSDVWDENKGIVLEKSVMLTILEKFGLNLMDLTIAQNALGIDFRIKTKELSVMQSKELEILELNQHLRQDVQSNNQRQEMLKVQMEVLHGELIDLRKANGRLQSEISKLLVENHFLLKKSSDMEEKNNTLEKENNVILEEATSLEHLYLIFKCSSEEKALELQLLSSDIACLHGIKNDLDREVRLMNEKLVAVEVENLSSLEECRRHLVILEDDLKKARNICKQLNQEIESKKDLLVQKDIELLQVNQKFRSTNGKRKELCGNSEGLQLDIDTSMVVIRELENKIFNLLENTAQKDKEIACLLQANEASNCELDRLHEEFEVLRIREEFFVSELQRGEEEVKYCEVEIARLLSGIHVTTVIAAVFEEKVFERLGACGSLEIGAMVQKGRLHEGITLRNENVVDALNDMFCRMERENHCLKEELSAYSLLLSALSEDITSLEEQTFSLAKNHASDLPGEEDTFHASFQDNLLVFLQHGKSSQESSEQYSATEPAGFLEFLKMQAKVKMLQKVVTDTISFLEQELLESNSSLNAVMKELEVLKSKGNLGQEEVQVSKDPKLEKGDAKIYSMKYERIMKNIHPDLDLSSSNFKNGLNSYGPSTSKNDGARDQMHGIRGFERDCNNLIHKSSSLMPLHEIENEHIEELEEEKIEYPSEIVAIKNSHQEWNRKIVARLSSNAQRLSDLQASGQELTRSTETSEILNCVTSFEAGSITAQLIEAEKVMLQLVDINTRLTKKVEDFSSSPDSLIGKEIEMRDMSRRQISQLARNGSEKIGRLERELQRIQYVLLKLEEEREYRRERSTGRKRIVLKDYLYGSVDSRKQKKKTSCGCKRPETKDE